MASRPMAITLPVFLSSAIMEGSSTTTFSLYMMSVLAVPKSIANSCVKKLKIPMGSNELQNKAKSPVSGDKSAAFFKNSSQAIKASVAGILKSQFDPRHTRYE